LDPFPDFKVGSGVLVIVGSGKGVSAASGVEVFVGGITVIVGAGVSVGDSVGGDPHDAMKTIKMKNKTSAFLFIAYLSKLLGDYTL